MYVLCCFYILPGEVTLACIGPLTNVAMAIRMDSKFGSRLKGCYIMGGNHEGSFQNCNKIEFLKQILQYKYSIQTGTYSTLMHYK
jgi:inosine-uridine nucleoside N-ribohydrolase